jgi:hypothetical protein
VIPALFCGGVSLFAFLSARFLVDSPHRWVWVFLPWAGWLLGLIPVPRWCPEKYRDAARSVLPALGTLLVLLSILMVAVGILNHAIDSVGRLVL